MAKGIQKAIQIYLSKLRRAESETQTHQNSITTSATGRLLSACKYPTTPSFSVDGDTAATQRFFENFNSLYDGIGDSIDFLLSESPRYFDPPSDVRSSQRFFVSPGTTNSLVEEARLSAASTSSVPSKVDVPTIPDDSVAVMTFSKDPYDDFRLSMQEMLDARHVDHRLPLDWDFMEELLLCYLELNGEDVHDCILEAFADLVVSCRYRFPAAQPQILRNKGKRKKVRQEEVMHVRHLFDV